MLKTPLMGKVPFIQGQDPGDHLHPECPVCRQLDPCCREQEGGTADAGYPRQSLHLKHPEIKQQSLSKARHLRQ